MAFLLKQANADSVLFQAQLNQAQLQRVRVGDSAYINLICIEFSESLPIGELLEYDLLLQVEEQTQLSLTQLLPTLTYAGKALPNFVIQTRLNNILHGSCRKPHHASEDALICVDQRIKQSFEDMQQRPDIVLMTGDQVYVDDVAGPMLNAIHQVIELLGLYHENFEGALVADSKALVSHPANYYQRESLLPNSDANEDLYKALFRAKKKPLFTSVHAKNHLMSLAEMMAMYLLVWSPELWRFVQLSGNHVPAQFAAVYQQELAQIQLFIGGLAQVRRGLAHVPVYMIFDDHDVTDDWNLTRGWEEAIYGHPFSKRIIGNAIIAYWLCQGWGNRPEAFNELIGSEIVEGDKIKHQPQLIDKLLKFDQWHYRLETSPALMVLDTRTQRWRSESNPNKPSGLMDWESLCELQHHLIGKEAVILVSAAPIYGVKLIEAIQKVFTFFGQALTVDAENWMAHKGTANVILNIFRHYKTPPDFIILSGDVHYSFVYEISLKFRRQSPNITQITASGIKNTFPESLNQWFDTLNQILYGRYSPLNWLTKRRNMRIRQRRPDRQPKRTLFNQSGIGQLILADDEKVTAKILHPSKPTCEFIRTSGDKSSE